MFFIKFGITKSPIGVDEYIVKCPSCESSQWADVMVLSSYAYFFVIPIFPTGKEANVICKNCGLKRYGASFDSKLISNYEEVKNQYKHPWFAYLGVGILALPVIIGILFSIFGK